MSTPFLGEIRTFGFNFAPRGYAMCNGQTLSISQNDALFSLLGTTYGGNGTTTFNLPDLRGRHGIHFGQGPGLGNYVEGEQAGTETVTLLSTEMPQHSHQPQASTVDETTNRPGSAFPTKGGVYAGATDTTLMGPTNTAGGNQPHNNLPPYLVLNYCIALQGVFPSRN